MLHTIAAIDVSLLAWRRCQRNFSRGPYASCSHSCSYVARRRHQSTKETVHHANPAPPFRISKDVSVLWADHSTIQVVLHGVREVAARRSTRAERCETRVNFNLERRPILHRLSLLEIKEASE